MTKREAVKPSSATATQQGPFFFDPRRAAAQEPFFAHGIQPKPHAPAPEPPVVVQRACAKCDDEELRREPTDEAKPELDDSVTDYIKTSSSGGEPLPSGLRESFEPQFGSSLSNVRVHADSSAGSAADALKARAFTVGQSIWFGAGQYQPATRGGQRLLAHELAHTLQQRSAPPAAQRKLEVGRDDDPAEAEADAMADRALNGEAVGTPAWHGPAIARQRRPDVCQVDAGENANQRRVTCGTRRFRVDLRLVNNRAPETRGSANLGYNGSAIWLDIDICSGGTDVRIRPSLDLPTAVRQALGNVLSGSDALRGVTLTPELSITLVQSESFTARIFGGPTIDLSSGEVTGGRVGVGVETEAVGVGGELTIGRGGELVFNFNVTPNPGRPRTVECSTLRRHLVLQCHELTTVPAVPAVDPTFRTDRTTVFLLFPYRQSTPVREIRIGDGSGTPRVATEAEITALAAQGFRVTSVTGFASPEGPRTRPRAGDFEGNTELAGARATSGQAWFQERCAECGADTVAPQTGGLAGEALGRDPELRGDALTREVVPDFLENDALRPGTEPEREVVRALPVAQQRDAVYPLLRRTEIVLERQVQLTPGQPAQPEGEEATALAACPDNVVAAVRENMGISIMTGAVPRR